MEIRGPFHVRCDGEFQGPDPAFSDPGNLPFLDVGLGHLGTAGIRTPAGTYTAEVAIPSRAASLSKTFQGGGASGNAYPGLFDLPDQCVPVADSARQLQTFVAAYLSAMSSWAGKMDPSQLRSQLLGLVAQANAAFSAQDISTTLGRMTEIKDTVAALDAGRYPYAQLILRAARNSIALLTQPIPAT